MPAPEHADSAPADATPRTARAIALLYVDDHVVVADKPSGLLVHRGWDNDDDVAMFRVRDAIGAYVHPIHRLDRGTSGALLFARTSEAAATLHAAFEARSVDKQYLALVRGHAPEAGVIDHPIPKSEDGPRVPALTWFELVARSPVDRCSLVLARPETGRLHQIRRHLRHIDHPLVGDVTYGSGAINRHYRAAYALHRLALHAYRLAFDHPVTGARVAIEAPVPADLGAALDQLGLPRHAPAPPAVPAPPSPEGAP
ncbi:MAG: pseudouridylate synthase [Labilithrix sp.]|nr:pseudouridylate synthase [Labilithrix sp.]